MTVLILVIDDELARFPHMRDEFVDRWHLLAGPKQHAGLAFEFIRSQHDFGTHVENDANLAVEFVSRTPDRWALVLLDMQFDHGPVRDGEPTEADPQFGASIQVALHRQFPALPIIQFTAQNQKDLQRQDVPYLSKRDGSPDDFRRLLVEHGRLSLTEKSRLLQIPVDTVVASEVLVKVYAEVYALARSDTPLLIRGETGSGKEHLAKYFHTVSRHGSGPLVEVQISSIPASLYESELFGHEKGAFTGAQVSRSGLFERAASGTIFLDEIGALPPELQAKLLRALGERKFRRLGSHTDLSMECGIVAATQDNLEETGFRPDLLARFRVVHVPSLADRPSDAVALGDHFLAVAQRRNNKRGMDFSAAARTWIADTTFSENARGIKSAIEGAVLRLSSNSVIQPEHLGSSQGGPPGGLLRQADAEEPVTTEGSSVLPTPDVEAVAAHSLSPTGFDDHPLPQLTTQQLLPLIEAARAPREIESLRGALPNLDRAVSALRQRLALVALDICRHPVSGKLKILPAMQLLMGSSELTPVAAKRRLNDLLDRNQGEPINLVQLDELISACTNVLSIKASHPEPESHLR